MQHELMTSSDHDALILFLNKEMQQRRTTIFHFNNEWRERPEFGELIKQDRISDNRGFLPNKLSRLSSSLEQWQAKYRDEFQQKIQECRKKIHVYMLSFNPIAIAGYVEIFGFIV